MKQNHSLVKAALLVGSIALLSGCGDAKPQESSGTASVHTVTFNMNGAPGSNSTMTVPSGSAVAAKKVNKESDGYYFVAWCTDEAGEHPYDFSSVITSDITLYASWNFHVYFYDEVGDQSAIATEYVEVRKDHTLDAVPECVNISNGKRFAYWYRYASNDVEKLTPIQFKLEDKITEPDLMYYAKCESFGRTFNFYIGDSLVKTSLADSDNEYVDIPTYAETFGDNEGFKGWYSDKTEGERFDFVDFSVVKENYDVATTNLYAQYENIIGEKSIASMVDAYKYKSYGAKVTKGIGTASDTFSFSLDDSCSANDSCKYGYALYPTIFKGNLYSKKYTLSMKLGSFSDSGLTIQPRIFILDETGNRVKDGELYTKNGTANSSGTKTYELYNLMAGGGADYEWTEDHYFQLAFEFVQMNTSSNAGSIQIESLEIFNSNIELTSDYNFDLSTLSDSSCDRCAISYDDTSKTAKVTNTAGASEAGWHYCSFFTKGTFSAKAGGTYKMYANIAKFSDKVTDASRAVGFFLHIKNSGASDTIVYLGAANNPGETVIDFSDKITADCDFTFRINFVCSENWQNLDAGYFQNEYVEISSLAFLTK